MIFAGTQMLPGDVAQAILGQSATPEALANLRRDMGLGEPALERYWHWFSGTATTAALAARNKVLRRRLPNAAEMSCPFERDLPKSPCKAPLNQCQ